MLLWVWVPLGSVLVGPIWRAVSPLRTVQLLLARACRVDPARAAVRLPRWSGYWPAAATLLAFVWLELVPRNRATVPVVLLAFAGYAVVMLAGAALFGSGWFARADPFEVYSSLAARPLRPHRRCGGRTRPGVRLFPAPVARNGQLPLLMVGYTYLGLSLLFAA